MGTSHFAGRRISSGVGLIELMIALSLGMTMILAVTEVATNNSRTRAELERNSRQLESATYALRMIEGDISNAGFWGEGGQQSAAVDMPSGLPPLCPGLGSNLAVAAGQLRHAIQFPIQGADASIASLCVIPKPGTDYLSIRRANSCRYSDTDCRTATPRFYLQVNACLVTSDSALPRSGEIAIAADIESLTYTTRRCDSDILAPRYRYVSRVFYLNSRDELVRSELGTVPARDYYDSTLVEGVEAMRFEYGIDSDGDGLIDVRTGTPSALQWPDVVMVRVSLVVRNLQPSFGFVDTKTYSVAGRSYTVPHDYRNHKRQLYSRTVSVRNIAGRREMQ